MICFIAMHLAITATCEHSFSLNRLVKIYLYSIMTDKKCNHFGVLKNCNEMVNSINIKEAIKTFISRSNHDKAFKIK